MEKTIARKFKWFWPWQDEQEEGWLREMSQQGWHLRSVGGRVRVGRWHLPVGLSWFYSFVVGEPRDYVYRLDFQDSLKDKQDYLQLFHDAGWENIGEKSSWQYFRKEVRPGEVVEIFTDVESKIGKYKRQLVPLGILLIVFFILFVPNLFEDYDYAWWRIILRLAALLATLWLSFTILRVMWRIRQLRKKGDRATMTHRSEDSSSPNCAAQAGYVHTLKMKGRYILAVTLEVF